MDNSNGLNNQRYLIITPISQDVHLKEAILQRGITKD